MYEYTCIIHDGTPNDDLFPDDKGRGLIEAVGYSGVAGVVPPDEFDAALLLDKSAIQALIKEREERGLRHRDLARQAGLGCKDQQQTNYCWINAPTYCTEYVRVWQNEPLVVLSAASAGAPMKNFRNEGGWGKEGLQWITDKGLVPEARWPANAISQKYYTPENRQLALNYRATEWTELAPRNLQQCASLVLRGIPVAVGYNWWSHEVSMVDFVWLDGTYWPVIRNSWGMGWGEEGGYAVLQGTRALPDDAVAPRVALAA
jgi:hypothetical protein